MPPVPAAVMMCESANDVTEMSERVPVGVPRSVEPSASQESSIDLQVVSVGDRADAIPVGDVADQVRDEDRPGARADHRLDRVDVDVVGVGLDVDEHRDESGAHDRRDVGRERDRGGDDLVAGLESEQLDREVQRRRPRVAHDAAAFAEELGDRPARTRARSCRCAAPADRPAAPRRPLRSRGRRARCRRSRSDVPRSPAGSLVRLDLGQRPGRHGVEHHVQLCEAKAFRLASPRR